MGSTTTCAQPLPVTADFGLHVLASASGLRAEILPSGALFALRHGPTLLNQLLPGPAEDGLFRLLLRWHDGAHRGWGALTGPAVEFHAGAGCALWRARPHPDLECLTTLTVHPQLAAWAWRITVRHTGAAPLEFDLLHAQDLGLGDEGVVRNNEAYNSHYLDLLPVDDASLGPVILARQNQAMGGGRHPWAAFACAEGTASFCTDGRQFFGDDHRLTGEPAAARGGDLPGRRLQYESALAGLQSWPIPLAPGASATQTFLGRFAPDHPAASGPADLALIRELLPVDWSTAPRTPTVPGASCRSVFTTAPWFAADAPTETDLQAWFPGEHRHVERDDTRSVLSFFHGPGTHVITRAKERLVARPHGHILRSGTAAWIDDAQFGVTCYAAGIFAAQAYRGNPGIARLLSVVRDALNVSRAGGQRVFVRAAPGGWRQLGVPTVCAIEPGAVRWLYRDGDALLEARVWCSAASAASFLDLRVLAGPPREFLVTHQLALGPAEFESGGSVAPDESASGGWLALCPSPQGFLGRHLPGAAFAIAAIDPSSVEALGGAELLMEEGGATPPGANAYAVVRSREVPGLALALLGVDGGIGSLPAAVARARAEFSTGAPAAQPPAAPVTGLRADADPGAARLNEILPWFTHNAAIHFSAPHGLEQYGGGAWGVRDVCQGSAEWLLAAGEFSTVRRLLLAVFAQQYAPGGPGGTAGGWPQWFMFPPFHAIQQAHSHGDVCFWPVKALCDYIEAANDFSILTEQVGYTDPVGFAPGGPPESLWAHCDRVVALAASRFLPGTALVNYGDGDWDDTLQPADPSLRTRMVSAWTVALAFQTFRQFAVVARRAHEQARAARLMSLLARMRADFASHLLPDGTVAGFLVRDADGSLRPLLHPGDRVTGIRYRLLPMTRSVLAELFTPEEAAHHLGLVARELRFTDGVRLMSEPAAYHGGVERLFKRAETAANFGREVGLQYVHAHLRYAEAMAKVGDADALWQALQVVNPVGLDAVVPTAAPRQSNVYFSSSDADFADRAEASARWADLRAGRVAVRAGWRLYSSGPGLYLHKVRACLLGVRESFGDVIFDPVLPRVLDGLAAGTHLCGRPVQLVFAVKHGTCSPCAVRVNGRPLAATRDANPYRAGGLRVSAAVLAAALSSGDPVVTIEL